MNHKTRLTPRAAVEKALRGGHSNVVPFTVYENKVHYCAAERELRNRGMCMVLTRTRPVLASTPNVKVIHETYWEGERKFIRTHYSTPAGDVSTIDEENNGMLWNHDRMFKSPDDYKVILFIVRDMEYRENYANFILAGRMYGEDSILRGNLGLEPLQSMISGTYMGMQDFCIEWMDNRDEILKIYDALVENRRRIYGLAANSPASHFNYGGNVVADVVGVEGFEKYYLPNYQEASEVLHKKGKFLGAHLDGNCRLLAPSIAKSGLDYIEAFTPSPDTDMTLAEARSAWPGKVLWMNFPSSVHLRPDEEVMKTTYELMEQAGRMDGIIMGITENMPPDRWQNSCLSIMDGLEKHALEHPEKYA